MNIIKEEHLSEVREAVEKPSSLKHNRVWNVIFQIQPSRFFFLSLRGVSRHPGGFFFFTTEFIYCLFSSLAYSLSIAQGSYIGDFLDLRRVFPMLFLQPKPLFTPARGFSCCSGHKNTHHSSFALWQERTTVTHLCH